MGQYFRHLRNVPFAPKFVWVWSVDEAADFINRPHEDYPNRLEDTSTAIQTMSNLSISNNTLLKIHKSIFGDTEHGGKFRDIDVRAGLHVAPKFTEITPMMEDLYHIHAPMSKSPQSLIDWYADFETIHPFQDGNGRVGGVIVAIYSHFFFPEKGWLAPLQ